jgi:TonB family protein
VRTFLHALIGLTTVVFSGQAAGRALAQDRLEPADAVRLVAQPGTRFTQTDHGIEMWGGRGLLRTNRFYADFVLRFQFQLVEPDTEAVVFVRSMFANAAESPAVGYRVHLSGRAKGSRRLGRVSGWRQRYSTEPTAAVSEPLAPGDWHDCELRVVGSALTVRIDEMETTRAANLEQLVGYVGFKGERGRILIRRVQIEALPASSRSSPQIPFQLTDDLEAPTVIKDMRPAYSLETMRDRVQGTVVMRIVIRDDGTVGDVDVIKPLHPDLDQSAVAAARHWLFRPATKGGQPVAVFVTLEMNFRIQR